MGKVPEPPSAPTGRPPAVSLPIRKMPPKQKNMWQRAEKHFPGAIQAASGFGSCAFGTGLIQIGEFWLAYLSFFLGAILVEISIFRWKGISRRKKLSNLIRSAAYIFVGFWFLYFMAVTNNIKGGKPGSSVFVQKQPIFHVTETFNIFNPTPFKQGELSMFDTVGAIQNGYFFTPINVLMFITVTNTSERPQTILGIGLQQSNHLFGPFWGPWKNLCNVQLFNTRLFELDVSQGVSALQSAIEIGTDNAIENALLGKQLTPDQSVNGLIAFQCPSSMGQCGRDKFRMKLLSAAGETHIEYLPSDWRDLTANLTPSYIHVMPNRANLATGQIVVNKWCIN